MANRDERKYRVEIPNLYDDADLDPYQFRVLVHIQRRGLCYESDRGLADSCKMSLGKVNEVKRGLVKEGWVEYTINPKTGQKGLKTVDRWQENYNKYCSPHEQRSSHDEQRSPHEKQSSPHERHLKKEPIQEEPIQELLPPSGEGGDEEPPGQRTPKQQGRDEIMAELEKRFGMATQLRLPKRATKAQRGAAGSLWWSPLWEMLDEVGGDMGLFDAHLKTTVAKMRRDNLTLSHPKSVVAVFKSIAASSASEINGTAISNQFERVLAAAQTGKWAEVDEPSKQVARDMGGSGTFKTMRPDQESMFRKQFYERLNGHAQR